MGHDARILCVQRSHQCSCVCSCSRDGTLHLWDVARGIEHVEKLGTLRGHFDWVRHCCWASDDAVLASTSYDSTVRLWCPFLTL